MKKSVREDYEERLRECLRTCGPEGQGTLLVQWVGGMPTSTGRSDYYEIRVMEVREGRPTLTHWLNRLACGAVGWRFNNAREAVMLGGCGYSKEHEIADTLARIAGHSLHVHARDCSREVRP